MTRGIPEKCLESAKDLWDVLSPTTEIFPGPTNVIFRGHADSGWSLVPSVLRENAAIRQTRLNSDPVHRVFLEARLLEQFAEHCDRTGVRIPGDSRKLRKTSLNACEQRCLIDPDRWPDEELFEVMAFAQHHGVPTRLLDWTRNPYAAVYFAASGALDRQKEWRADSRMAIWAFNIELVGLFRKLLAVVKTPGSVSPNIAAQAGVFTVQNLKEGSEALGLELEEQLCQIAPCPLLKITLPSTESIPLLDLCERVGISASSLFPGAGGAAKATVDSVNAWIASEHAKG